MKNWITYFTLGLLHIGSAYAFNSEEHKFIVDRGVSEITIPPDIQLPNSIQNTTWPPEKYNNKFKTAKKLAVGFDTSNKNDYNKWKGKVQDNCYSAGYGQLSYNKNIWLPGTNPANVISGKILSLPVSNGDKSALFTMGELAAFYGDYRRTSYCDASGKCYLTDKDTPTLSFSLGNVIHKSTYCPDPITTEQYQQDISSGVVPPFGKVNNFFGNTAQNNQYGDVGWWGDEVGRINNVDDWHFSNGAVAWYIGMHRLALYYVNKAYVEKDPKYWTVALHHEANALHTLTDLFSFGHDITSRGQTAAEIIKGQNLQHNKAYELMQTVLKLGGGERDKAGRITLGNPLAELKPVHEIRNDFINSRIKGLPLALFSVSEGQKHASYNKSGAIVRNLNGTSFQVYGDGKLRDLQENDRQVIFDAVKTSVQSLFDAYTQLGQGIKLQDIDTPGNGYFAALKYVPAYVEEDAHHYFLGRWLHYAQTLDKMTKTGTVPNNWEKCSMPIISGQSILLHFKSQSQKCMPFN